MSHTLVELEDGWLVWCPGVLGDDETSPFDLHVTDEKWRKSTAEEGGETGARILRDGNVAELYDKLDEGKLEDDRSNDGDFVGWIERQEGEDRRTHRRRLSQSLTNPWETLISCSFKTRKDGRTSGQCAQHLRITWGNPSL